MLIKNCYVLNEKEQFQKASIRIENDRIQEVVFYDDEFKGETLKQSKLYQDEFCKDENDCEEVLDAKGAYAIPGLIDTHIHGAIQHDFCDKDVQGLIAIASYLKDHGITAFCPTSMTLDKNLLKQIFETVNETLPDNCSEIVGIHMEGPFISKEKKGAQNDTFLRFPSVEMFHELSKACGHKIKIITLAPEVDHCDEFIQAIHKETNISVGHTTANYATASKAFSLGANRVTHIYNAMPAFTHREPGVVGAAFDHKEVYVELIADGIHVHPSVIRSTFSMFGEDRVVLISDAMMATGMATGEYELGGQKVFMKDRKATLSDGTIAGSATNLMDCVRHCVSIGIPLETAVKAATKNAAKSIGIFDEMGSIDANKKANIVLLDKNLEIETVLMNGVKNSL